VICPDFVRVFSFPDIPDYSDEDNVWLLFPGQHSLSLQEAVAAHEGRLPRRLIVLDATWKQTSQMCRHRRLARLTCVRLDAHQTAFWRQQVGKPEHYLATIEVDFLR
jgi:DTW domain-containing protein YfiP